jgi:hypothetical protein
VFLGLPVACLVFARRFAAWHERGWAIYSMATGVAFAAGFILFSVAFGQAEPLVAYGGILQRATLIVGWTWLTLLAVYFGRSQRVV